MFNKKDPVIHHIWIFIRVNSLYFLLDLDSNRNLAVPGSTPIQVRFSTSFLTLCWVAFLRENHYLFKPHKSNEMLLFFYGVDQSWKIITRDVIYLVFKFHTNSFSDFLRSDIFRVHHTDQTS